MLNMLKLKTSPNQSKSLILGSRDSFSTFNFLNFNFLKKINSSHLMLQPQNLKILGNVPHFCPSKIFSFWHYIPIDNHWIDHSYQFWPPNPYMRHAVAHERQVICSQFMRKPLIAKLLERCLLVATGVPFKFQLTLDPCRQPFIP